ncbi:recombinase family protein [Streptomyces sp. NPDC048387]|uniref:recombinase family protein n=1 Tax=Streptomyces sp. NPDC048387 TaxID=3365542 RepID=UPI003719A083
MDLIPVASYARTSQDSRPRDERGVRNQHRINERTARDHGCVVVATYTDNARSATKDDRQRPGFDRLLADLHRGHAFTAGPLRGVVAVADDRLYRRPDDFIRFMAALTSEPDRVYVGRDGLRDPYTKQGLLQGVESLQGAVAEGRMRSLRVQDWHWSRAMDGLPHSGPRPFGWQEDRQTPHPVESELVRKAIEDRIAGSSMGQVAREWAALGMTGTRGGRPNPQTVTQIITAPRVCGFRAHRGELLIDPDTGRPLVGAWEAIVPPAQWAAVCATFSAGSLYMHRGPLSPRLTGRKAGPKYVAICGERILALRSRDRRRRYMRPADGRGQDGDPQEPVQLRLHRWTRLRALCHQRPSGGGGHRKAALSSGREGQGPASRVHEGEVAVGRHGLRGEAKGHRLGLRPPRDHTREERLRYMGSLPCGSRLEMG